MKENNVLQRKHLVQQAIGICTHKQIPEYFFLKQKDY